MASLIRQFRSCLSRSVSSILQRDKAAAKRIHNICPRVSIEGSKKVASHSELESNQCPSTGHGPGKKERYHDAHGFMEMKTTAMLGLAAGLSAIGLYSYHQYKLRQRMAWQESFDEEASESKKTIFCDIFPTVHAAKGEVMNRVASEVDAKGVPGPTHGTIHPATINKKAVHNFIADAVETTIPAVVYIEVVTAQPFFSSVILQKGGGSGFFISPDGLILTNAHVVSNVLTVNVRTSDGTIYEQCPVEAIDRSLDLATVRIPTSQLRAKRSSVPVIKLGHSSSSRPGEFVVALGSPYSLTNTITSGIISSMSRKSSELGLNSNINYIQTDASINIGNSGGPLIDLNGEAIGINSMRVTDGIAFAIPSDVARKFLIDVYGSDLSVIPPDGHSFSHSIGSGIKKYFGGSGGGDKEEQSRPGDGTIVIQKPKKRRYLGIVMLSLNEMLISQLIEAHPNDRKFSSLDGMTNGVLVLKVTPGSPACIAGVQVHDVITEINGVKIESSDDVYKILEIDGTKGSNEKLTVTIIREGMKVTLIVNPQ